MNRRGKILFVLVGLAALAVPVWFLLACSSSQLSVGENFANCGYVFGTFLDSENDSLVPATADEFTAAADRLERPHPGEVRSASWWFLLHHSNPEVRIGKKKGPAIDRIAGPAQARQEVRD